MNHLSTIHLDMHLPTESLLTGQPGSAHLLGAPVLGAPVLAAHGMVIVAAGGLVGAGLFVVLRALLRPPSPTGGTGNPAAEASQGLSGLLARWWPGRGDRRRQLARTVSCVAFGVLVWWATGWPAAGALAALGGWWLPGMLGPDRGHQQRVARIEAIATWAEMLRDVLSAAAGLEQALHATVPAAPQPIRPHLQRAAARLDAGLRLPVVLRELAADLDDPVGDLVVAVLVLAAERQARHLAELLGELATAARAQAAMRLRVETGRARTRTSVRVITGTTLVMAAGLTVLDRPYLQPYNTPTGQLVLAAIGGLFGLGLWWLAKLARGRPDPRILNPAPPQGTSAIEGGSW